jgi:hypothetical protein
MTVANIKSVRSFVYASLREVFTSAHSLAKSRAQRAQLGSDQVIGRIIIWSGHFLLPTSLLKSIFRAKKWILRIFIR